MQLYIVCRPPTRPCTCLTEGSMAAVKSVPPEATDPTALLSGNASVRITSKSRLILHFHLHLSSFKPP